MGLLDWSSGGLIGIMARKEEMEALVSKKAPPQDGSASYGKSRPASATHKALITRNLKLAYGQVAGEAVPKRLLDILSNLDTAEDKKS
ncbi:MAG: hypothetical protein H7124_05250 [Phycisphaerales bacterium]|nr:hypothetical protein [Hyphomonadaceae bacterium]